jgi:UDP-N-acetylmuramate--alanine ligase
MGIGGSGMSGVADMAQELGYSVSGCDLEISTPYLKKLLKKNIVILEGHSPSHVEDVDILAVTPATFFQNKDSTEILAAKKVMTWQKFLGEYLHVGKEVVCVAGTHGKSTTSAMLSLVLEAAGEDPLVMVGATIPEWGSNARVGKGSLFVTEADEFYDNFLNYSPDTIILNNIEFDHPDFFKDEAQLFTSFTTFIERLKGSKTLIANQDDPGVLKLLSSINPVMKVIGYSLNQVDNVKLLEDKTTFTFRDIPFELQVAGEHNISNALGVITFALERKLSVEQLQKALFEFKGIGRRMEFIGKKKGISVYDDYAHHPTAIAATLKAIKQKHPESRILAIVEPHTFSRTKALLPLYKDVFVDADDVVIAPIFKSRDTDDFGLTGMSIVEEVNQKNIRYIDNFDKIIDWVLVNTQENDVIIVMGAGKSYTLSRSIINSL